MAQSTDGPRFSWLHFSDLRFGGPNGPGPNRPDLLQDLDYVLSLTGPFDAIFLSGNLVAAGSQEGFEACGYFLRHLLEGLKRYGIEPTVLAVPGDEDLVKASSVPGNLESEISNAASVFTLPRWAMAIIGTAFASYDKWTWTWIDPSRAPGALPGDFSCELMVGDRHVGIIGLNTASHHSAPGTGTLDAVLRSTQVTAACQGDPDRWRARQDLAILLTHHSPRSFRAFEETYSERVAPPGRFQLHLCGHAGGATSWGLSPSEHGSVIQAPPFSPTDGTPGGAYVAGSVRVDDPQYAEIWIRKFDPMQQRWVPFNELRERMSIALPAKPKAPVANQTQVPPWFDQSWIVEKLRLTDFRCFDSLELELRQESRLDGEWTCIAGINGAGKSSVVQALCLGLLGEHSQELGGGLLKRMRRMGMPDDTPTRIEVTLTPVPAGRPVELSLTIDANGLGTTQTKWPVLRSMVVTAYGATRNLASKRDHDLDTKSPDVRRMITPFQPLAQLANAEVLLTQQGRSDSLVPLFTELIRAVFQAELSVVEESGIVRFVVAGKEAVEALDLPDGFRSSAAWLADLCAAWCEKQPEKAKTHKPADIEAIVMIDEVDLHLHPSLQRELVPRLRKALPKVQWIVTTHSPLVLANFDANEIIALDRDREGNVRPLDRQILGFTTDQIYEWLMGTRPTGAAIEEELRKSDAGTGRSPEEMAALMRVSPDTSDEQAREQVAEFKDILNQLKP